MLNVCDISCSVSKKERIFCLLIRFTLSILKNPFLEDNKCLPKSLVYLFVVPFLYFNVPTKKLCATQTSICLSESHAEYQSSFYLSSGMFECRH